MREHIATCDRVRQKNAIEIHINDFFPLIVGRQLRWSIDGDAGIGVAKVQTSQPVDNAIDHVLYILFTGYITPDWNDLTSCSLGNFLRSDFSSLIIHVNYGNIRFAQVKAAGEQLLIRVSDDFKADKVRLAFDAKDVSVYSTRIDMKLC